MDAAQLQGGYDEYLALKRRGLVIDLFAGGGGASIGIENAIKRPIDIALNHDPYALALHGVNHPRTVHFCQSIEDADPDRIVAGRPVFLLHASPSCTQFSRSRRALPAERQQRDHAWKVLEWVEKARPLILTVENVAEFQTWGPLTEEGYPDQEKAGEYWEIWTGRIRDLGYTLESRVINAADLGAYTARERLIVIARRDGLPIAWPNAEYGPGRKKPWNQAADHIDWSIPAPSIFGRKKPLSDGTMERIRKGIMKHVIAQPFPFIAPPEAEVSHGIHGRGKVAAFLAQNHTGLSGRPLTQPVSTICAKAAGQSLVTVSFIDIARQNSTGSDLRSPVHTICASGNHHAEVRVKAFLSEGQGRQGDAPEIIRIEGRDYIISDIGYRMLDVDELWSLQGFDIKRLKRNIMVNGKTLTATRQKKMIGNSVVPIFMQRIIEANLPNTNLGTFSKAA